MVTIDFKTEAVERACKGFHFGIPTLFKDTPAALTTRYSYVAACVALGHASTLVLQNFSPKKPPITPITHDLVVASRDKSVTEFLSHLRANPPKDEKT